MSMTRNRFKLVIITLLLVGLLGALFSASGGVSAGINAAPTTTVMVMDFDSFGGVKVMNPQKRGESDLARSLDGIAMNIDTTDLPVGAYTVWWVIFNNPSACTGENGACVAADTGKAVGNPTEAGVLWATGGIVGPDRIGHFSASLGLGVDAAPGPVLRGPGLTNPLGADVHLVVRYHGPAKFSDPIPLAEQITTVGGTCDEFPCFDPQVAIHD